MPIAKEQLKMSELDELKKLAGITEYQGYQPYGGSNISITGNEKGELMKKHDIRPGTEEWFKLWFSLPYLTGEKPMGKQNG
jgi:hypothetical protein